MLQYIVRRLIQFIPVFFGVTLLLFFITTILPGRSRRLRVGERAIIAAVYERAACSAYGLDKPWYVQYVNYLKQPRSGRPGHFDLHTADRSRHLQGDLSRTP